MRCRQKHGIGRLNTVSSNAMGVRPQEYCDAAEWCEAAYGTSLVYGFGHTLYYDDVIKALRGEAPAETDGREGLRSLELLVAIYESVGFPRFRRHGVYAAFANSCCASS